MSTQSSGATMYSEDFLRWAKILDIPLSRWDEPLIQEGLPLLARAERLQLDLTSAKVDIFRDGADFGTEEVILRVVVAMLQDKLTGKNVSSEYIKGKMAACGYVLKKG